MQVIFSHSKFKISPSKQQRSKQI